MGGQQHNRRDFLRGRAALAAAVEVIESAIDRRLGDGSDARAKQPTQKAAAWPPIVTLSRRAMACEFELRLAHADGSLATQAGMAALEIVDRVEDELTVYRETSDLIELNAEASEGLPVEVAPDLFDLLTLCDRIHRETGGAFDPTSGPLSRVWGFHRRAGRMPGEDERAEALAAVSWGRVLLDPEESSVTFADPSVEVNANSIGKGYALDRAAVAMAEHGVADYLIHGGRSTLLARGSRPGHGGEGWQVGLRDPLDPERRIALLHLHDEALSTSGSGTQFFEHEGRIYGHLIDPRTGWPAEGLFSATVLAPTAAEADAYSTAAYILGVEGMAELCRRRQDLRALLVAPDEACGLRVHAYNLPDEAWRPDAASPAG